MNMIKKISDSIQLVELPDGDNMAIMVAQHFEDQCDEDGEMDEHGSWHQESLDNANRLFDVIARTVTEDVQELIAHAKAEERERHLNQCVSQIAIVREGFSSETYATGQPLTSLAERFACNQAIDAIRNMETDNE